MFDPWTPFRNIFSSSFDDIFEDVQDFVVGSVSDTVYVLQISRGMTEHAGDWKSCEIYRLPAVLPKLMN